MQLATKNKLKNEIVPFSITESKFQKICRCLDRELLKIGNKNNSPVTREKMESNLNE